MPCRRRCPFRQDQSARTHGLCHVGCQLSVVPRVLFVMCRRVLVCCVALCPVCVVCDVHVCQHLSVGLCICVFVCVSVCVWTCCHPKLSRRFPSSKVNLLQRHGEREEKEKSSRERERETKSEVTERENNEENMETVIKVNAGDLVESAPNKQSTKQPEQRTYPKTKEDKQRGRASKHPEDNSQMQRDTHTRYRTWRQATLKQRNAPKH